MAVPGGSRLLKAWRRQQSSAGQAERAQPRPVDLRGVLLDGVALVPASVRHLRITGATYLPLAGTTEEVELAVATRRNDQSPQLSRVLWRAQALIGGARPAR